MLNSGSFFNLCPKLYQQCTLPDGSQGAREAIMDVVAIFSDSWDETLIFTLTASIADYGIFGIFVEH